MSILRWQLALVGQFVFFYYKITFFFHHKLQMKSNLLFFLENPAICTIILQFYHFCMVHIVVVECVKTGNWAGHDVENNIINHQHFMPGFFLFFCALSPPAGQTQRSITVHSVWQPHVYRFFGGVCFSPSVTEM